jgi:hypothetical protein
MTIVEGVMGLGQVSSFAQDMILSTPLLMSVAVYPFLMMASTQSNLLNRRSSIALHVLWSARVAIARVIVNNDCCMKGRTGRRRFEIELAPEKITGYRKHDEGDCTATPRHLTLCGWYISVAYARRHSCLNEAGSRTE